jgi:hypothetical protein
MVRTDGQIRTRPATTSEPRVPRFARFKRRAAVRPRWATASPAKDDGRRGVGLRASVARRSCVRRSVARARATM